MRTPIKLTLTDRSRWPLVVLASLWVTLHLTLVLTADSTNSRPAELTVKGLFGSDTYKSEDFSAHWMNDESAYLIWEPPMAGKGKDLVRVDAVSGKKTILVPASDFVTSEGVALSVESYSWSKDKSRLLLYTDSKRVWRTHSRGNYWVLDRTSHELIRIGGEAPASTLMFAKFSPDGRRVAYVRERNIYLQEIGSRRIKALTTTPSEEIINGTFDWVYEEELSLQDGFRWSPDGASIAYWQLNTEGVREMPLVNNTEGLYPKIQRIKYPKTGELNAACRIGVIDLGSEQTRWMDIPGDPREHYLFDLEWPEGSKELFIQQLNRLQNTNRVFLADPLTGQAREILVDTDAAWVEGHANLTWNTETQQFLFWSERSGWDQLYWAGLKGEKLQLVTPGKFDVTALLRWDKAGRQLYFMASPNHPSQRYLYRAAAKENRVQRVTPEESSGTHSYSISPNGRLAFHTVSSFQNPPMTELVSLPDHKRVRLMTENKVLKEKLAALKLPRGEFFRVPVGDGVQIDAWALLPPSFDPSRKYPLIIYVYGEPAGQTVKDQWGGTTGLWHQLLAQQGYVVMSFDNRGTATPRGRDWRKSIYRKIGVLASQDQADAVRHVLAKRPYLDATRVGVWGWSGGGSMTLNALLRYPDLYSVGISIASVPNMRLYDTIYQERYMGLPSDNADGYIQGSPLTFAHQLKGSLLLIHGTGDDNCHYQGAEALMNAFIESNKPFRMMAYPNRSHSINEGANTSLHLREMMTSFFLEKLPAGAR